MTDHHHTQGPHPPHHPFVENYLNSHQITAVSAFTCLLVSIWAFMGLVNSLEWGYAIVGVLFAIPPGCFMKKMEESCMRKVKIEHAKLIRRVSSMPARRRLARPVHRAAPRPPAARNPLRCRHVRLTQAESERLSFNQYA